MALFLRETSRFFDSARRFTLIEMLVVVAIIGILASLLMPSMNNAIEATRSSACLNNERQIGVIMSMYESEFSNKVIPFQYYFSGVYGYMSILVDTGFLEVTNTNIGYRGIKDYTVFICPSGVATRGYGTITDRYDVRGKYFSRAQSPSSGLCADSHYALNGSTWDSSMLSLQMPLDNTGEVISHTVTSVKSPGKFVRLLDGYWGNFSSAPQRLNARHLNDSAGCVLRLDGSSQSMDMVYIPENFALYNLRANYPETRWRLTQ